jgi:hypothetical protein
LFVADFFHPVDDLAVECFLNGDMRDGGGWRGAMPVLLVRRKGDDVAGTNLFDWPAFALGSTATGGNDLRLTEWMGVPCGASTGLERDAGGGRACWSIGPEQGIDADCAGEPVGRSFAGRL